MNASRYVQVNYLTRFKIAALCIISIDRWKPVILINLAVNYPDYLSEITDFIISVILNTIVITTFAATHHGGTPSSVVAIPPFSHSTISLFLITVYYYHDWPSNHILPACLIYDLIPSLTREDSYYYNYIFLTNRSQPCDSSDPMYKRGEEEEITCQRRK